MLFIRTRLYGLRFFVFSFLSIMLMVMDHHQHQLRELHTILAQVATPIQYAVDEPIEALAWVNRELTEHQNLIAENQALSEKQLVLESNLDKLKVLEHENNELRALLKSSPRAGDKTLVAEILDVDADPFVRQFTVSKGKVDGIFRGQAVMDAHGIIGQIIQVNPTSSTVLLVTDVRSAVPVENERNGLRAILSGTGDDDELSLIHVSDTADIQSGDLLVTSGLDGIFPRGYPVGVVNAVSHDVGSTFSKINVAPLARLNSEHQVLISWPVQAPAAPQNQVNP